MSSSGDVPALSGVLFGAGGLDRQAQRRSLPGVIADLVADPGTQVVEVAGDCMAVQGERSRIALVRRPAVPGDIAALTAYLGEDRQGRSVLARLDRPAATSPVDAAAPGTRWRSLRQVGAHLDPSDASIFATAVALAQWHATHPHCPRCGAATEVTQAGWVRRCPQDGSEHFPASHPAVIMSVLDGADRLLLARNPAWPDRRFSVLAGFVEPGETFEAAVAREVREEVGVAVRDIRYLGNQPWPFPASLMVGYTCVADDPTLTLDPHEVAEARWFGRDEYRSALAAGEILAPSGISIARRLIERWFGQTFPDTAW